MIKQWIKRIKIYLSVHAGDIIYGYTPVSRKVLKTIPEFHRKRPLLVVGKKHGQLLVYMLTSRSHNNVCYRGYKDNGLPSYIVLDRLYKIPVSYIFEKREPMNLEELQAVNKIITLENEKGKNLPTFNVQHVFQSGDIVRMKNHLYLILSIHDGFYTMNKLHKEHTHNKQYALKGCYEKYYIDMRQSKIYPKNIDITLVDIISNSELVRIKRKQFESKRGIYSIKYPIGQTFINNNKHYLYLFTLKGKLYVLPFTDEYWELNVITLPKSSDFMISDILDVEEYHDALSQAIDAKVNTYQILEELQHGYLN